MKCSLVKAVSTPVKEETTSNLNSQQPEVLIRPRRTGNKTICIRLLLLLAALNFASAAVKAQTGPSGLNSGIMLWLDASDINANSTTGASGSTVTTWKDKSGNGKNATYMGSNAATLSLTEMNGAPAVKFSKSSLTSGTAFEVNNIDIRSGTHPDVTVVIIYKQGAIDNTSEYQSVWGADDGGFDRFFHSKWHYSGAVYDGAVGVGAASGNVVAVPGAGNIGLVRLTTVSYVTSGTKTNASSVSFNGQAATTFTDNTDPSVAPTKLTIGYDGSDAFFNGYISEVIVYDHKFSACENETMNAYLSSKYGVDYSNYSATYKYSGTFPNDINAIGRFSSTNCSLGTAISAAKSGAVLTISNPSNNTSGNKHMAFGSDNGTLTEVSSTSPGFSQRLSKLWRIDHNGNVGTVDVSFDLATISPAISVSNPYNFALIIDNDANFSNASTIRTPTITGNKITFSNITLADGDYITLATKTNYRISSNGGQSTASVSTPENSSTGTTVIASDITGSTGSAFTISGGADAAKFNINASTGALTFKTAPDYENPTDNGTNNTYEVAVTATKSSSTSVQTITFTVSNLNDTAPVITSGTAFSVPENSTAVSTVTSTDADGTTTYTYSIIGGADQSYFNIGASTGVLTFKVAPDFEGAHGNTYQVTVQVSDQVQTVNQTITVTVTNVNEFTPVITSNGGGATAIVPVPENTTAVTTVTATDGDGATTLTYSISGGADASFFEIDAATGILKFKTAPDFEGSHGNTYVVIAKVADPTLFATQTITVNVTNVNDITPVITSNGGGATAIIAIAENTTAVSTVTATDADGATTFAYSLPAGADKNLFTINSSTGILTFNSAPDFEGPHGNTYLVTVQVSDGIHLTTQDITVNVTDVNEHTPAITSNGGGAAETITLAENTTAVTTVTSTDADGTASLSYSLISSADQNLFTINPATGVLMFNTAPDFEGSHGNTYLVTVQVSDGIHTATQNLTVNVTDVNEHTPVITSNEGGATAAISVGENTTSVTTVTATDADGTAALTFSLSGGTDKDLFSINPSTGVLTFNSAPDFEGPHGNTYLLTVQVSDGIHTKTQNITVSVTDINEHTPSITSNEGGATATISIDENITAVTTVTATDADGTAALTYSLAGGTDIALFNINSSTGALTFLSAPDFEGTHGNSYLVNVQVSDGIHTATQNITVNITDAAEENPASLSFTNFPSGKKYGDADFTITASSNHTESPVTYESTNTAVATIAANGTVHITGVGSTIIKAAQAKSYNYVAAEVTETLTIAISGTSPEEPAMTGGNGNTTNNTTPTFSGTTDPGSTVSVVIDSVTYGPVTADENGHWEIIINPALNDGPHDVKVVVSDQNNNTTESPVITVVVDTEQPSAPPTPTVPGGNGTATSSTTPAISGTAEPGGSVVVVIDGVTYGPVIADENGHWEIVISPALNEGPHEVKVIVTDKAGNSSESPVTTIVVDTKDPETPVTPVIPGGSGENTNNPTPSFSGTTEPGATVVVVIDGVTHGPVTADENGHWEIIISPALNDGPHEVKVIVKDEANNSSESPASTIIVDTKQPEPPATPTVPGGNGSATNTTTPTFSGTTEPGASVVVVIDGVTYGPVTADENGHWEIIISPALNNGSHEVKVVVTDTAGNNSESPATTIIVKPEAPATPAVPTVPGGNGSATNDTTPAFSGTTEPGSTVVVVIDGVTYGPVTADENGHWEIIVNPALTEGSHEVKVVVKDIAGNTTESPATTIVVKTDTPTTPAAPVVPGGNGVTSDPSAPISGTGTPGTTMEIYVGGQKIGETTVDVNGNWTYTFNPPLAGGSNEITTVIVDEAGNRSEPSAPIVIVVVTDKIETVININAASVKTYGDADFSAQVSTNNTQSKVIYSSSNTAVLTVNADGIIHITGAGSATLTAMQELSAGFKEATASKEITVNKATQSIVASPVPLLERRGASAQLSASATSGLPLKITSSNPFVFEIEGTTIKPLAIGTARILLSQEGDDNYLPASAEVEVRVADSSGEKLIVNKIISPNGDGINDMLEIEGLSDLSDYHLVIFSRNGVKVFETRKYPTGDLATQDRRGFNGVRFEKESLPAGTYFYNLEYKDGEKTKSKTGYFLIRY